MSRCQEHQAQMIAFLRGELSALEHARAESHLARCAPCMKVAETLGRGLAAAGTWRPGAEPAHLARLVARLAPYMVEARPAPMFSGFGAAGLALAASAAVAVLVFSLRASDPAAPAARVAATAEQGKVETPAPEAAKDEATKLAEAAKAAEGAQPARAEAARTVRRELAPHLRAIASEAWDGKLERTDPKDMLLSMETGFAVLAFRGGEGRKLTVAAPGISIEVIGTEFYVDATRRGLTTLGVVSGRVRVSTPSGDVSVGGGEARAWSSSGAVAALPTNPAPAVDLADPFLEHGHEVASTARVASERSAERVHRRTERPRTEPAIDAAELLARAEQLASSGRPREALDAYAAILALPGDAPRALVAYEMARIRGFQLGEVDAAREELRRLAAGHGSVASEAALSICELELGPSPCEARACLEALSTSHDDEALRREADRLIARWGLAKKNCGTIINRVDRPN